MIKNNKMVRGYIPVAMIIVGAFIISILGAVHTISFNVGHINATSAGNISAGFVSGGSVYTETTIALTVTMLFLGAFSLQIARNYFLRTLDKFTLRLGADIWWLAYVMIRDGLMFGTLLLGFELFYVGTFGDYPIAVPFMPLSIVLVAAALLLKLIIDTDENETANKVVTALIAVATFFYLTGVVFVTESIVGYANAGYVTLSNGSITTSTGGSDIWTYMYNNFSSTVNTTLAVNSFYACFTIISILGLIAFLYVVFPNIFSKASSKKKEQPSTRKDVVKE